MSKTHTSECFNVLSQIVPYLMITAMLVSISYVYGNMFDQYNQEAGFNISNLL